MVGATRSASVIGAPSQQQRRGDQLEQHVLHHVDAEELPS